MDGDDRFEPLLGRLRASPSPRGRTYLRRVLAVAAASGPRGRASRRRFTGAQVGRGAGVARLLSADRFGGLRARRAVVKTRLVRLGGKGLGAARAHLRYIQRDAAQGDGRGTLFGPGMETSDGGGFIERCSGDRHQFRLILSPEDGAEYDSLEPLVRRFMAQMERDLATRLDWVAAEHRDTGRPHAHVILRGRDEGGGNLVIARDYIARGMRERLADLATVDLGPRQDLEIEQALRAEVRAERLTSLDRTLLRGMDADGLVTAGAGRDPFRQALRMGRLRHLELLGLAEPAGEGRWRLAPDLDRTLQALAERGDIIRTMQRELGRSGLARSGADLVPDEQLPADGLVGRVVTRGLADEAADTHFLIVDAVDGRAHHVLIGQGDAVEPLPEGCVVRLRPRDGAVRPADVRIAAVAEHHHGIYSAELHKRDEPGASPGFIAAHERRLEALRRAVSGVERLGDGSWSVGSGFLKNARAHEEGLARRAPVAVDLLSPVRLERLASLEAATWLDRELEAGEPVPLRDAGFGKEVRSALAARRQWLVSQGLAAEEGGRISLHPGTTAELWKRELRSAAARLSGELNTPYRPALDGTVSGRLVKRVDLASGRFALLQTDRDFTLVPWRPVLKQRIGREISGDLRGSRVSWTLSRGRTLTI